jgi:RNA polymerase sigma-70 factor (ECF subfamily)
MPLTDSLRDDILASVPSLRAFAISLSGNGDRADDLVQETLLRAIDGIETFHKGSNLEAWLFTIMRNNFNNEYRKSKRWVQDQDDWLAETIAIPPEQVGWAVAKDLKAGLAVLSPEQQQALVLVGAAGMSYDQVAEIAGCQAGTIKSRVHRARSTLAAFMSGEHMPKAGRTTSAQFHHSRAA